MIRATPSLLGIELRAFLAAAIDGDLVVCAGERPADPEAAVTKALVTFPLIAGSFTEADGQAALATPLEGLVRTEGRASHFRVRSSAGVWLIDGEVGVRSGDLRLRRLDFLPGDRIIVEALNVRFA